MVVMEKRQRWLIPGILLIAVILRVGVALYYGNWVPANQDDNNYSQLAWRLTRGHGYSFPSNWYPFTPADTPTAHWSFLYTAFVALIYRIAGFMPVAVRLVGAILGGLLLPWMVYRLTRQAFPSRTGMAHLASAIAAIYAYFILYAARIMTETFFAVTLLWSLILSLQMAAHRRSGEVVPLRISLSLGLSLGLTALFRQSILPWTPVLFLWLLVQGLNLRRLEVDTLKPLIAAGLVLIACIVPWTVRNYVVYGHFLLLNSNTGYAMYSAQHPMHGTDFQEHAAAPLPGDLLAIEDMTEPEWDRALMQRGIRFVAAEPGRYLKLSLSRVLDFYEFWPTPDTPLLHNVGRLVSFTACLPFVIYGSVLALTDAVREARKGGLMIFIGQPAVLLLGFSGFYALLHILTWAMPRYRIPVDAVTMPFVALAMTDLYRRVVGDREG